MTMEFKGFSMREYTSRMRSVNVVKCWPFEETDEDVVKSLLPPITVKKFTWWFEALELSQNVVVGENSKNKLQEKGDYMGMRGKHRAPKKRSIKELFAVAPPVDRVNSEEEDDDEQDLRDSKEIKWGLKGKRNEKKKKKNSKEIFLSKLKKPKKKINKFKKKKTEMDLPAVANKEICFKLHLQSHGVVNKLDIDISEAIPINKVKTKAKGVDEKKKSMAQKVSKVTAENEDSEFPIRGILKNHTKVCPRLQSRNHILEKDLNNSCGDKHVTFSDKDNVLECRELRRHLSEIQDSDNHAGENRSEALSKNELSIACNEFDTSNVVKEHSQDGLFATSIASYQQGQGHVQNLNAYGRMIDTLGDHGPRFPPFCLKTYNEPFPRLSPKELLRTLCSSPPEVNQKRPDRDFIGLPLNSQGELIKLNSRGIGEFHQTINPSNIASTSSVNLALNQFPIEGCMKENPFVFVPSRLGITESQHVGKTVEWDPHPRIESYYDRDHVFPHLVQSKMRLMGKEFLVGGNELWKDKQIVAHEHQRVDGLTFYSQSEPSLGKLGETWINPDPHNTRSIARDPEFPIPRPGFHGLPRAPGSVIRFPFMHPDLEAPELPSWSHPSSNNASPLLFDVAQNEALLSYGHPCFGLHSTVGPTCLPDPRVTPMNEGFCLHNSFTPGSMFQNSIPLAQMNHLGLGPCYSGIMPSSVLPKRQGSNTTFEEPMRSGMSIRGPRICKKARKGALGSSDDSLKPVKRPKFGIQEASNFELDFAKNKAKILAREDSTARSGPVKLTAGGKHILKACQMMDQSGFKSTHSTVPFEETMTGFRLLESEKSAQIYRF